MDYTEKDVPVKLHHGEMLTLDDGTIVRFEANGEAKDVFLDDGFAPTVELFPSNYHNFTTKDGKNFKVTAFFEDAMLVEKV